MALLRPFSGTASLPLLQDIINRFGPDSFLALTAGTMYGCSETTFYVIAVYFGSVGIRKTRHAIPAGLVADVIGPVASRAHLPRGAGMMRRFFSSAARARNFLPMTLPVELFLALRYLRPRRTFVSIITVLSLLGVMLGVTVLIVVLSVMSGLQIDLEKRIIGFTAHITISNGGVIYNAPDIIAQVDKVPGVLAASAVIEGPRAGRARRQGHARHHQKRTRERR